jgi:hypothetical protein
MTGTEFSAFCKRLELHFNRGVLTLSGCFVCITTKKALFRRRSGTGLMVPVSGTSIAVAL